MLCNIIGYLVDIIGLIAHEIIDGDELPLLQIVHDTLKSDIFSLSHDVFSNIMCNFAAKLVQIERNTK